MAAVWEDGQSIRSINIGPVAVQYDGSGGLECMAGGGGVVREPREGEARPVTSLASPRPVVRSSQSHQDL